MFVIYYHKIYSKKNENYSKKFKRAFKNYLQICRGTLSRRVHYRCLNTYYHDVRSIDLQYWQSSVVLHDLIVK